MRPDRHRWLAERAHAIWEQEGCPEGRALQHWLQAEEELCEAERSAPRIRTPAPRAARKPAALVAKAV